MFNYDILLIFKLELLNFVAKKEIKRKKGNIP